MFLLLFLVKMIVPMKNEIIEAIKLIFQEKGKMNYGENITQLEHAIQCWTLAVESNASLELRVAAFLHDLGHLTYEPSSEFEKDFKHEELASTILLDWGFPEKVATLVNSHVWAKRYLVSNEAGYSDKLSLASLNSFNLQGGYLSVAESEKYSERPYFEECLQLRRWDDEGKRLDLGSEIPNNVWKDIEECING